MLEAALAYAAAGFSVVPLHSADARGCSCRAGAACGSAGKHPALPWKPYQDRRSTTDEIRAWWRRWPHGNVGVVTGMISGVVVIDVDWRNGGFETLVELDARGYVMPDNNPVVITATGGLHHWFALDAPLAKAAPYAGIDVQADGALVVVPPSRTAVGLYRWARGLECPRPPVPRWLRATVEAWLSEDETEAAPPPPLLTADEDDLIGRLRAAELYLRPHRHRGWHHVVCPGHALHSNEDPGALLCEPGTSPAPGWGFKCLHAHCEGRRIGELLDLLEIRRRRR